MEPVEPEDESQAEERWRDFQAWMQYGVNAGRCSLPVCVTHEGLPQTDGEADLWEQGEDPCQHGLRLWSGDEP